MRASVRTCTAETALKKTKLLKNSFERRQWSGRTIELSNQVGNTISEMGQVYVFSERYIKYVIFSYSYFYLFWYLQKKGRQRIGGQQITALKVNILCSSVIPVVKYSQLGEMYKKLGNGVSSENAALASNSNNVRGS